MGKWQTFELKLGEANSDKILVKSLQFSRSRGFTQDEGSIFPYSDLFWNKALKKLVFYLRKMV